MSWNRLRFDENGSILLLNNETELYKELDVEFEYENGGGFPGAGEALAGNGTLVLTTQRLIFINTPATSSFSTFSCPLTNIEEVTYFRGWISRSGLTAAIRSVPNEGFTKDFGHAKFGLKSGGNDFKFALEHLRSKSMAVVEELPAYNRTFDSGMGNPPEYK